MILRVKTESGFFRLSQIRSLGHLQACLLSKIQASSANIKILNQSTNALIDSQMAFSSLQEGELLIAQFSDIVRQEKASQQSPSPSKKQKCSKHGPEGKCIECLNYKFEHIKRKIEFCDYLKEVQARCKGHQQGKRCNSCLPPQAVRYSVDMKCTLHAPYPKSMCNRCMAPTVTLQPQEYLHVQTIENPFSFQEGGTYLLKGQVEKNKIKVLSTEKILVLETTDVDVVGVRLPQQQIKASQMIQIAEIISQQAHQEFGFSATKFVIVLNSELISLSDQFVALHKHRLVQQREQGFALKSESKVCFLRSGKPVSWTEKDTFIVKMQGK